MIKLREPEAMHTDDTDAALVWAAQAGDTGAFAALLARHRPPLLALCRRMLGDPALAEDAAQEASLQALLSLDRLQAGERFGAWLAGIGLNVCRMWLRARARECWSWDALHRAFELREAHHDAGARAETADLIARVYDAVADVHGRDDPQAHATTADLVTCVRRAVAELPRGQRAAVLLFYLSGLSYAETAALLGIDVGAVRTRLHKARGALRTHLWAVGKELRTYGVVFPRHLPPFCRAWPAYSGPWPCLAVVPSSAHH